MGIICMKPDPKTTANHLRELEKGTELGENYSCSSSSQPVLIVEFTIQGTSSSTKTTSILVLPYGILSIVEFPKPPNGFVSFFPKMLMGALNLGPVLSPSLQEGEENQSQEQPSSKWINHSKNAQLFQGVYQKIAWSSRTK